MMDDFAHIGTPDHGKTGDVLIQQFAGLLFKLADNQVHQVTSPANRSKLRYNKGRPIPVYRTPQRYIASHDCPSCWQPE